MCPRRLTTMSYKKSMLEAAVKAVIAGTFTTKQSASVYGVPAGTISTHLRRRGYSRRVKRENGSLAQADEQVLEWLQLMSEIGCFSLKNQLGDIIREVLERLGVRDKVTAKMSSQTLTLKFLQRNPDIPSSFIENKEVGTNLTAANIDEWLAKQKEYVRSTYSVDITEFLVESNAGSVFCCFEVGSVFPSAKNMFSRLIYKPKIDGPLLLTLYCCLCADGSFLKPVAIVKSEDASQTRLDSRERAFHVLYSKHAKMDCEAAMLWLQLIDDEIQPKKEKRPFLIYLDQFIRPLSLATLDFCRQHEFILYYLPGHYPYAKLPFGMDVFYNLNGEYDAILASDDAKHTATSSQLTTLTLLVDAWKQMLATNASVTEFRDFGILPLDPTALKSIVETIVPITVSNEGACDNAEVAHGSKDVAPVTEPSNFENNVVAANVTPGQVRSPQLRLTSGVKRVNRKTVRNYKESSDTDERMHFTSAEVEDRSVASLPGSDIATDYGSQPNIKMKFKRSNETFNEFRVEPENPLLGQSSMPKFDQTMPTDRPSTSSDTSSFCSHCSEKRQKAIKSGVIEGLVFALRRIESSLRADTLHMYKTRYLSPYLRDHRPTEPSFLMWCEIMKCLEMGPEAVLQDYRLSQNIRGIPLSDSTDLDPMKFNPSASVLHNASARMDPSSGDSNGPDASKHSRHSPTFRFEALPASETDRNPANNNFESKIESSGLYHASEPTIVEQQSHWTTDLNNNSESRASARCTSSIAGRDLETNARNRVEIPNSHTRRSHQHSGMPCHFDERNPNCSALAIPHQLADNREDIGSFSSRVSAENDQSGERGFRSFSVNQYLPIAQYPSHNTLENEDQNMVCNQYQPNFEARASELPRGHQTYVARTTYELPQNQQLQRMQNSFPQQAQNVRSQHSFFSQQQRIRFSSYPFGAQHRKQVAAKYSVQGQNLLPASSAPDPGPHHFSSKMAETGSAGFPAFCTPYKQASTPKSSSVLPGRQSIANDCKPQLSAAALDLTQNQASKIEQSGFQSSYLERMSVSSHSTSHALRDSASALKGYGMETHLMDEMNQAPMTSMGCKVTPDGPLYCTPAPSADSWFQNSATLTTGPRAALTGPPSDVVSNRVEAFDSSSVGCSAVQHQQSVVSYQSNYSASVPPSYTRSSVTLPVTAAEESPKSASYINL